MHVRNVVALGPIAWVVMLWCGGCSQPWQFAPAEIRPSRPALVATVSEELPYGHATPDDRSPPAEQSQLAEQNQLAEKNRPDTMRPWDYGTFRVVRLPNTLMIRPVSFDTFDDGVTGSDSRLLHAARPPTQVTGYGSELMRRDEEFLTCDRASQPTDFLSVLGQMGRDIGSDYRHYYTWETARNLGFAVAGAAVLANTAMDENFQNWYQDDVRSSDTDRHAVFWKTFGEGQIFIPAFLGLGLIGNMFPDQPILGTAGDFGDRVSRGYIVGAPPMLMMQYTLGGSRPNETSVGSQWKPFDDSNAVSGHAFMGAVPFITAAKMTDRPLLKAGLYACSTFTAWSRVNDDDHYLSQMCLGWWMAYLACEAIDRTENPDCHFALVPVATPQMSGIAMIYER